jgi:hypothetical protein
MTLDEWIVNGEVGSSSRTMWSAIKGIYYTWHDYPRDPSDLRRCMLLVDTCTDVRQAFDRIATMYPYWLPILARWDVLIASLREEMKRVDGMAPNTYAMMKAIEPEVRKIREGSRK